MGTLWGTGTSWGAQGSHGGRRDLMGGHRDAAPDPGPRWLAPTGARSPVGSALALFLGGLPRGRLQRLLVRGHDVVVEAAVELGDDVAPGDTRGGLSAPPPPPCHHPAPTQRRPPLGVTLGTPSAPHIPQTPRGTPGHPVSPAGNPHPSAPHRPPSPLGAPSSTPFPTGTPKTTSHIPPPLPPAAWLPKPPPNSLPGAPSPSPLWVTGSVRAARS